MFLSRVTTYQPQNKLSQMSWFIQSIGSPAAVKADLAKNRALSPKLLAALQEICDDKQWPGQVGYALMIEGSGHSGEGSSINSLKVSRVRILAPADGAQLDEVDAAKTGAVRLENYGQTVNAPPLIDA